MFWFKLGWWVFRYLKEHPRGPNVLQFLNYSLRSVIVSDIDGFPFPGLIC